MTETPFKTYVCRYYHNRSWWGLNIMAADLEDAKARVAKLGNLQLQGELVAGIPANVPCSGLYVRLRTWLANCLQS